MHHTREIPRDGWADYLTLLSSIERDHWVRIEADGKAVVTLRDVEGKVAYEYRP